MSRLDRSFATFRDTLEAADIDVEALEMRADGTLGGPRPSEPPPDPEVRRTLEELRDSLGDGDLELGQVLGEGGMGLVREARQRSLGRVVAVKALRPESRTDKRVREFIREARVTGHLEHPNVVPIHGLALGEDGEPRMIMKRVFGTSWLERIDETFGRAEHLQVHLPVLRAVCNALEAAHAQGILHRDLKPENVLVGDFGEVLVGDWGLAVAYGESDIADVARTGKVTTVVGTPRYMAPEMAVGDGRRLGPWTDVYLLGATLHHILTNEPRHHGDSLMELLYQAYASEPFAYPEQVPEELAAIANRACDAEPEARYRGVAELRRAIEEFESHASSTQLARQTARRLEIATEDDLTACRFGFEQALSLWPDNPVAQRGLVATLTREIEHALDASQPERARALLTELARLDDDSASDLADRLSELELRAKERDEHVAELERSAHEANLGLGVEGRRAYGVGFGVLFCAYNVVLGVLRARGVLVVDHVGYTVGAFAIAAAVGTMGLFRLQRITPNRAARMLLYGLAVILTAQVPVFLALGAFGIDIERALAVSLFQLAGSTTITTLSVAVRFSWVGLPIAALGALGLWIPQISFYAVGVAYAMFFIGGAVLPLGRRVG
ncbi:MAG: serine/threonine-protein kinase [Sandaracinaceae bacterium]